MIYLDNAATTMRKPPEVIEAVAKAMGSLGNDGRGVNSGSLSAGRVVFSAREKLAAFLGCSDPSRVCFTANSTQALNTAIFGLVKPGDHVISTDLEHNSVLRPLYKLEKQGVEVSFLPADKRGCVNYEALPGLLRPNTKLLVTTHASNLTGNALDIQRLGAFAKENGLLYIVDASQTAGTFPIRMEDWGISVLCVTGHKGLMGPQGTGALLVGPDVDVRPLLTGGTGVQTHLPHQPEEFPTRLEAGTLNGHGLAGLAAAIDWLNATGPDAIHHHELALMERFYQGVTAIPGVTVYGDFTADRAPIVTLNVGDMGSDEVSDILSMDYDIATRSGAHCAPRMHAALGTTEQGAVRFSFGWYNTAEEVDAAIEAIRSIAEE